MPGSYYPRLKSLRTPPWLAKLPGIVRDKVVAHVDARAESAAAIFRRLNLIRFVAARTFREYVQRRRQAIADYNLRREQTTRAHSGENDAQPGERTIATGAGAPGAG